MQSYYPRTGRIILHIDMNCFYASVEMAHNPTLKNKPLAIAGNPEERKGIIVTSSYEAREKGVKTTMPLWQARRLCPELIVMRPNFNRYREASRSIFKFLAEITPLVEPISIDEGYLDITECKHLGHPLEIAKNIQQGLLAKLDLPSSIGIAPNKFLAKMASDMQKPLGLTILRKRDLPKVLWPLPVGKMHGVGERTKEKLEQLDIYTIGDLASACHYTLKHAIGVNGERLIYYASGEDNRPVDPEAVNEFKSIGSSKTLPEDTIDERVIFNLLRRLIRQIELRLSRRGLVGASVQLMIRYHDHTTVTRSQSLNQYIYKEEDIYQIIQSLWEEHWNREPVRLLGVTVQDIEEQKEIGQQLDLFSYEHELKKTKLSKAIDSLTGKYGDKIFGNRQTRKVDHYEPTTSFQKDFLDDYKK